MFHPYVFPFLHISTNLPLQVDEICEACFKMFFWDAGVAVAFNVSVWSSLSCWNSVVIRALFFSKSWTGHSNSNVSISFTVRKHSTHSSLNQYTVTFQKWNSYISGCQLKNNIMREFSLGIFCCLDKNVCHFRSWVSLFLMHPSKFLYLSRVTEPVPKMLYTTLPR